MVSLKGKDHKNTLEFFFKSICKTEHFEANCMEIGYLLLKISRFYIFKMAANGGCHFEINMKVQNYETQFISQKHAYTCTFDNCNLCLLCKQSFYGVISGIVFFS